MVGTYVKLIKNDKIQKLCRRQTNRDPKKGCCFFFNSHNIQKVSGFLLKLREDGIESIGRGRGGNPTKKGVTDRISLDP